jgi:cytochrome c553
MTCRSAIALLAAASLGAGAADQAPPVTPPGWAPGDAAAIARGKEIADARRCTLSHLADYQPHDPVPRLAGQPGDRLLDAMHAFRDGKRPRGGTMMAEALDGLSDADIAALTAYLASRPP